MSQQPTNNPGQGDNSPRDRQPEEMMSSPVRHDTDQAVTNSPARGFSMASAGSIPDYTIRSNETVQVGQWFSEPSQMLDSPTQTSGTDGHYARQYHVQPSDQGGYNNSMDMYSSMQNGQNTVQDVNVMPANNTTTMSQGTSVVNGGQHNRPQQRSRPIIHQQSSNRGRGGRNGANTPSNTHQNGYYDRR